MTKIKISTVYGTGRGVKPAVTRWLQMDCFKTLECHSSWEGGRRLANQNPRLPSHKPSQSHLAWHSGTKVVSSEPESLVYFSNP
jgi:hypothetical protein